ncbi:hypothetical protein BK011_07755 [Tenericutes bacterium MZ-XQ]|nr:hypothetical protein BK011_07755 [Tenericutes bacterium MZ-XQ]
MTYAMTLDNSWELMTEDEMYDVNGGGTVDLLYISYNDLVGLLGAAMMSGMTVTYAYMGVHLIAATVGISIPVLGLLASAYILAHAAQLAVALIDAAGSRKGIMIQANTFWGIPTGTFSFSVQ